MKKIRKTMSVLLVVLMLLTSAPLQGFVGLELPGLFSSKVQAAGVSGYNAVAAAEWAKAHVYDTWSCLYGQGYWEPGTGDCANFVSQCIYMGGVDQTDYWNHTGYKAHYSQNSNGSWIRASQLHDYVVSIGGVDIQNPSASQIEVGDLMFYKQNPGTSGFSHCAIVTDVNGGQVTVAAHTINKICYTDTNWHLGFSNEGTHLVKMYGGKCTDKVIRDFDVYTAGSNANVYSKPSTSSTRQFYFFSGEYVHVYETRNINGVMWGYTCGYGAKFAYGWVKLSTLNYKCHVKTGPVSHIMGNWYVKVQPTCTTVGVEERVCSRCGYTEQRNMSVGGKHKSIIAADCLNPSYCTACGATISAALGHDWSDWSAVVKATCLEGGEDKRSCNRCGITENRTVNPLGHNHQPVVDIPTCVTDGTSTFECTRCGDSYIEESEWSAWTDEYSEQYFIDNLIPESMYESRTEYRYRDKKYTTEDSTSASLSKSGWNWYKSEHTGYTDYGATQGPVYSDPGSSDTRKSWSESYVSGYGTTRHYYYFRYANSDGTAGSDAYVEGKYTELQELDLTYALTNRSSTTGETGVKGWMVYYKSSNYNDSSTGNYKTYWYKSEADVKDTSKPIYGTRWYYQDRSKMYTNYFWQWDAWSDWSEIEYTQTDERAVETRTVYRVKQAALGHIWDDGKIVSPTCHEDGYTEYTCNRCGVSIKENIIPALGDLWGEKYLISEEGVTPRVYRQDCIRGCGCNCGCYKTFIEECEYEVTGVTEATCTEKGYTTYTCVLHGETYDSDYVDALGHKEDGQWFVTKAPTCTESGEAMCKCVRHDDGVTCDKTYTRSIDAVGHSLVKTAAVAVTCEQDGNSEYYQCKICNKYFADSQAKTEIEEASWIITATGHNGKNVSGEEIWITELEASCGVTGRECLYCLNEWCDYESSCEKHTSHNYLIAEREIEEIAPDYAIVEHKDSTCIELGYDIWSCLNCYGTEKEHGWTEIINFMPHDWCDPIVAYATCTEGGTETIICNYCKREETYGTGEATGHALSPIDEGYESSADKMELISSVANVCGDGSVDTYQCTHIDKNASARCTYTVTIGEAKEHSLGDYIITLEPTCTEEGYKHKECTNEDCGYRTADETIPSIGHDWNLDKTIEPTCETQGYDHYICKNDNSHVYDDNNKSMLGHETDNNWVVAKEPTCAEKGEEQCKCIRHDNGVTCSKIFIREIAIDPDAHDWGEWETVTPATCEEDGLEKRICKNDASHVEENILPAINHDWDDGVIDPASTCKTHGTKTYTCQNDNSHKKTEEVALDENNHVGETYIKDDKAATCTEDGYTGDTYCSDCNALLEKGEVIPATDHDWGEWKITTEPTYDSVGEKKQVCNNDASHINTESIPVLTRPSDENENIETDKTVDYDKLTGEAVIRLLASSKGETITTKARIPLDIVLVLDQSGSMGPQYGNLIVDLRNAVEDFTAAIHKDAVENGIDHRIAMVGFAMQDATGGISKYENTEILTTGGEPIKYSPKASEYMNEAYRNALVPVDVDGSINPALILATENLEAKGATAADLGLDMACKIFAQHEKDPDRKRIVVFMTDGEPTYSNGYSATVAQSAESAAGKLKGTEGVECYNATIYSVGVLQANADYRAKPFLKSIASAGTDGNKLYYDCTDATQLVADFQKIAKNSTVIKTDFDDITLVDTVSPAFTLTYVQEQKLRVDAIEKLGVKNEDITVTRYPDGTTEIEIRHITPKKIENGSEVSFVVDFSFSVTANENALVADSYVTNTDNAGVILGTKDVYENNFAVPDDNVEEAEGVIYFNINGITYHVVRVHAGDKIAQPEIDLEGGYTFSGWDIPDEITFEGGKYTIDATLDPTEYTVTWIMDNKTETDVYHYGDIIDVPVAGLSSQGDIFTSWDKAVPTTMPAENLTFTAVYSEHKHAYEESVSKKASCGVEGEMLYTCLCGDSYNKTIAALTHKWSTMARESEVNETAFSSVYCENCGDSPDENLSYTIKGKVGWKTVEYDLKLIDAHDITINDKGKITVSLPIPEEMKDAKNIRIYREEEDGTLKDLGGVKEGVYITFTTDHFSKYIIKAIFECDETGKHTDSNCDKLCDICGVEYADLGHRYNSVVTKPTCTAKGYTTHTCSVCGDSYTDAETAALGHCMGAYVVTKQPTCTEKGSEKASCSQCDYYTTRDVAAKGHNYVNGKCTNCGDSKADNCSCNCHKGGFMGFLWKIVRFFIKLFRTNKVCSCGVAHY